MPLFNFFKNCFSLPNTINKDKVKLSSVSLSLKGTKRIAKKIAKLLHPGDTVLLYGDLGAGKSVLVRNILELNNVTSKITSPTFTLVNEYKTEDKHFYHFDMYRLEDEEEAINIGFEDILDDNSCYKFVEWAENVPNFLPKKQYKKVTIIKLSKKTRKIILEEY